MDDPETGDRFLIRKKRSQRPNKNSNTKATQQKRKSSNGEADFASDVLLKFIGELLNDKTKMKEEILKLIQERDKLKVIVDEFQHQVEFSNPSHL